MSGETGLLARLREFFSARPDPMPSNLRLLVGLGNPGPEYERTRHNVGFLAADMVAARCRVAFDTHKANAVWGAGSWRGRKLVVAKPTSFMNRSGKSVSALMRQLGVSPADILVFVDDIHLSPGDVRIRSKGGSGGHNGIDDIIEAIGTQDFPRLRIGIGSDFGRGGQSDYVLSEFDADEQPLIDEAVTSAAEAGLCFVSDGIATAMNRFNRRTTPD